MPQLHTCLYGHRWEDDNLGAACPRCAGADEFLGDSQPLRIESGVVDELPPPPGPALRSPVPPVHGLYSEPVDRGPPTISGYEVLSELGRGGMGVVYKARHVKLNRLVALKIVVGGALAGPVELERFRGEAEAVAALQHPNIVQIFEVGEQDGVPYLALELVEGGTLAQKLADNSLPARSAAKLAETLARAVQYAHGRGIIHRDLKPANILLQKEEPVVEPVSTLATVLSSFQPKITDFGLAMRLDSDTGLSQSGQVLGTPAYMAPEQARGSRGEIGPPTDVYALGAILYECLTARPPFHGPSTMDTLRQVIDEDPIPPRELRPYVPRDLEAICMKCLEKEPRYRYSTAAEMAEDLSRFLDGEPVSAHPTGIVDRLVGALDRAQLRPQFAAYGSFLLALAPVMLLPEVWVTVVVWNDWPGHLLLLAQLGRVVAFLALLGYCRGWRWLPRGPAERQLWAVWGGYIVGCFALGVSTRITLGFVENAVELRLYPGLAVLTALAFFSLAANFWGYCAPIGLGFLALTFAMAADLRWAPLEFGTAWAAVLMLLGCRLRRLSRLGSDQ